MITSDNKQNQNILIIFIMKTGIHTNTQLFVSLISGSSHQPNLYH